MARADSTVRVAITGDASGLQRASKESRTAMGGIGRQAVKIGGIIAGAFAIDAVFDFAQSALSEADRVGDATARLKDQLGDLADPIIEGTRRFEDLGQSQGDVLELSARIADIGTAAGIADSELAPMTDQAVEAAAALALIDPNKDAATILDLIGKGAAGSDRPLKDLGVNLTDAAVEAQALATTGKKSADALTDGELAAARLKLILDQLEPRVDGVTGAEADLETTQLSLQAKFETFTGMVGDAVDGPLLDLLNVLIDIGESAGTAGENIKTAGGVIRGELNKIEGPLRTVVDLFRTLVDLSAIVSPAAGLAQVGGFGGGSRTGPVGGGTHAPHPGITVQVNGGSPEVIQSSVERAIRAINGSGPTSGSGT